VPACAFRYTLAYPGGKTVSLSPGRAASIRRRKHFQLIFSLFAISLSLARLAEPFAGATSVAGNAAARSAWKMLQNFHALCHFGAVATAARLVLRGRFIPKTGYSDMWTLAGALGRRMNGKRFNRLIPKRADRVLGCARYAVPAVVVHTTRLASPAFSRFDPCYALFRFWTGEGYPSGLVTLGAVCAASLFVERPWCRWFCPPGGLPGLVQLLSPWKIRQATKTCASCGGGLAHSLPFGNRLSINKGLAAGKCRASSK
jgi:polyferredoxin